MLPSPSRRQFTALLLSAAPATLVADAAPVAARKLDLRIGEGFEAREADIRAVLLSTGEALWKHCPNTRWEVPGFFIFHSKESPITVYDHRADGRVAIGVTSNGTYWSQFAFQFAHEFCHALAGHSNDWKKLWIKGRKANHWLEESLCETASLFAMRAMGETWKSTPPYPNWKSYAGALTKYAADRIEKAAADLPVGTAFPDWFRANEPAMREKATIREKNNVVAIQLLPIFEARPSGWEAITFMNLGKRDPEKSLAAHFADWREVAPPAQREFIGRIAAVFGVRL